MFRTGCGESSFGRIGKDDEGKSTCGSRLAESPDGEKGQAVSMLNMVPEFHTNGFPEAVTGAARERGRV